MEKINFKTGQTLTAEQLNQMQDNAENAIPDVSGKVDKIDGKSLSTNDFTDAYKNRVDTLTDDYIKSLIENGNGVKY